MAVALEEMEGLVGFRFPGGEVTIEHWENALVHDVTCLPIPRHDVAHPMFAFSAPLAGMGMTYQEFFDLCRAESNDAIRAGTYDFVFHRPLRIGVRYRVSGEIVGIERKRGARAGLFDLVTFRLDLDDDEGTALTATNQWIFLRS